MGCRLKRALAVLPLALGLLAAPTASAELLITPISDADDNPTLFNEIVNTINEVAQEFPEVRGTTITTEVLMPGTYAVTYNPQKIIEFNELYSSDAEIIPEMFAEDVEGGFILHWGGARRRNSSPTMKRLMSSTVNADRWLQTFCCNATGGMARR